MEIIAKLGGQVLVYDNQTQTYCRKEESCDFFHARLSLGNGLDKEMIFAIADHLRSLEPKEEDKPSENQEVTLVKEKTKK